MIQRIRTRPASRALGAMLCALPLQALAIEPFYDGFIAFATPTCSSADAGSITTGTRTATWNTPATGAIETRVDSVNGRPVFSPDPYDAPAGTGTMTFAGFLATDLGPYPFTYTFQLTTTVGGVVTSVSSASIQCVADGAGGFSFVLGAPQPALENPQPASFQSGIGLVSGWSCNGPYVGIAFDGGPIINAPRGSGRGDTASACGTSNTDTGYGLLYNFNLLGNGTHTAQLYVNGQAIGPAASFTVTAPAGEFLAGVTKQTTVTDFPSTGVTTTLIWQQSQQNFAVQSVGPGNNLRTLECNTAEQCRVQVSVACTPACHIEVDYELVSAQGKDVMWDIVNGPGQSYAWDRDAGTFFKSPEGKETFGCNLEAGTRRWKCSNGGAAGNYQYGIKLTGSPEVAPLDPWVVN